VGFLPPSRPPTGPAFPTRRDSLRAPRRLEVFTVSIRVAIAGILIAPFQRYAVRSSRVKFSQLRNALHAFFSATDPATTFTEYSPETPRSRREVLGLLAVGVVGTVALIRLAIHVSNPVHQAVGDGGISGKIVQIELSSLWLHPALYALAHHPPESDALDSQEAFRSYARKNGLEHTWYIFKTQQVLADGRISVSPTIRHPFRMPDGKFSEFPAVLATAAGKPLVLPAVYDLSTAEVFVIPKNLLSIDPIQALPDLELLERPSTSAERKRPLIDAGHPELSVRRQCA
jgi:hypothetical protein